MFPGGLFCGKGPDGCPGGRIDQLIPAWLGFIVPGEDAFCHGLSKHQVVIGPGQDAVPEPVCHDAAVFRQGFGQVTMAKYMIVRDCFKRSEEHTSELQSLLSISYAVFCLKKKQNKTRGL